jgi:O-antigen ligase
LGNILLKYVNSFFNPRNVISFLILFTPFTLGIFPFNYIFITYICIVILILQLFYEIPNHIRLINVKILFLIFFFILSFFLSMVFGLDYKAINDFTDFDSSLNGALMDILIVFPMQLLIIFFIYVSINSISDIKHYIKVFIFSGIIVNSIAFYYLLNNFSGRLGASFSDSNYFGRFEIFIISLSLIYILFQNISYKLKIFYVVNIFVSFVFLILSYSRSAILTLGLTVTFILMFFGKKYTKYLLIISLIIVLYFVFSFTTSIRISSSTGSENSNLLYNVILEPSNFTRIILNIAGFNMFLDYPIFGIGYHNFYNAYINYSYMPLDIPFFSRGNSVIHSWLFTVLAEQGLVGTISFVIIIFAIFKKAYSIIKNNIMNEYKFYSISLFTLFFVIIFNGLFFPTFIPELVFSIITGIILGYFKITMNEKFLNNRNP